TNTARPRAAGIKEWILSRVGCGVLSTGWSLQRLSWGYWMLCTGPSWWFAYRHAAAGKPSTGELAERVKMVMALVGVALCIAAPLFSSSPLRRRLPRSLAAGFLAAAAFEVSRFVV